MYSCTPGQTSVFTSCTNLEMVATGGVWREGMSWVLQNPIGGIEAGQEDLTVVNVPYIMVRPGVHAEHLKSECYPRMKPWGFPLPLTTKLLLSFSKILIHQIKERKDYQCLECSL